MLTLGEACQEVGLEKVMVLSISKQFHGSLFQEKKKPQSHLSLTYEYIDSEEHMVVIALQTDLLSGYKMIFLKGRSSELPCL